MAANTDTTPATSPLASLDDPERAQLRPCACSFVHVEGEDVRCTRTTKRTFAPGHDAQLKSRLITAVVNGLTVREVGEDGKLRETTAALAAGRHGFGYQVAAGVARAQRQAAEKAERAAARDLQREANRATREAAKAKAAEVRDAKRQQASADRAAAAQTRELCAEQKRAAKAPKTVSAKVGRWSYEGVVDAKGRFVYKTKSGDTKKADKGSYVLA